MANYINSIIGDYKLEKNEDEIMFLTLGFIIGFAAGWFVNEKIEDLAGKVMFWKKDKKK